jgi:hypothetical protein
MANQMRDDSTPNLLAFHETRRDDVEKHWFTYEVIWSTNHITNEASKITQLETTFRDKVPTCYMKYKVTTPAGRERSLTDIKRDLLRKF